MLTLCGLDDTASTPFLELVPEPQRESMNALVLFEYKKLDLVDMAPVCLAASISLHFAHLFGQ